MNPIDVSKMTLWSLLMEGEAPESDLYLEPEGSRVLLKKQDACTDCGFEPCLCNNPELPGISQVDFEVA